MEEAMFKRLIGSLVMLGGMTVALAAQQPAPAAAVPPATYLSEAELAAAMKKSMESGAAMATARVAITDAYRINLIRRSQAAGAIVHSDGHEVHHITDGAGTIVTGGTVVGGEGRGAARRIEGGLSKRVAKGDVVIIPVNTPHQYTAVEGSITYLEIRFPPAAAK
jgi:mannose-6-phosphate isomerase-like protein (cupin superfamily)